MRNSGPSPAYSSGWGESWIAYVKEFYIRCLSGVLFAVKSRYIASSVKIPWQVQRRRDYARRCAIEQL